MASLVAEMSAPESDRITIDVQQFSNVMLTVSLRAASDAPTLLIFEINTS